MFDPEEFFGTTEATKVLVCGDFTFDEVISLSRKDEFLCEENSYVRMTGATRAAQFLGALGFDVSVCGVVREDSRFIEMQEMLYTHNVDVGSLRTIINGPISGSKVYMLSQKEVFTVSASVDTHSFSGLYLNAFKKSVQGMHSCVFVENQHRTMNREALIACLTMAREAGVKTAVVPYCTGRFEDDSRYFQSEILVGSYGDIYRLASSCKLIDGGLLAVSEIDRLAGLVCAKGGSIYSYGNNFWISSSQDVFKSQSAQVDMSSAGAVFAAVLSSGYRFDQAAWLASLVVPGIEPKAFRKSLCN